MTQLSATLARVAPSPTIAMTQLARDMAADGGDVLSLTAGEPDFPTPPHVAEAAIAAIRAGKTRYTAVDGVAELKTAIVDKWRGDYGLAISPDQVSVGTGGKQVIFNALLATLNPGDEVIIPAPYWVSYPDMVRLCGGTPVIVPCDEAFRLTPEAFAAALTPRSRWVILNAPGNPSGALYARDQLAALMQIIGGHDRVGLLSDDIYEAITYEAAFVTPTEVAPHLADRVLTVNGMSKGHAMTGWRIGYGVGQSDLIAAMRKIQSQSTSNPCSIAQWAAVAALTGPQDHIAQYLTAYRHRRDLVVAGLNACEGITCAVPEGAFYVLPSVAGLLGKRSPAGQMLTDDEALAMALLREEGVATVFGSAFGAPGHLRLSFAASDQTLRAAVERVVRFCAGCA